MMKHHALYIDVLKMTISFPLRLSGSDICSGICRESFDYWFQDVLLMKRDSDGVWRLEKPLLFKGSYHYRFLPQYKVSLENIAILN
jgi:hypothetical protein